ncbi:MAG: YIP1 family protein [Oscillospiraceae bacterium]|nr:YIP1 family protein [Oscillospiraceae bacterium]
MQKTEDARSMQKAKSKRNVFRFIALLICLILTLAMPAAAFTTYTTYIYTYGDPDHPSRGFYPVESPDAYVPEKVVDSTYINRVTQENLLIDNFLGLDEDDNPVLLDGPQDLCIDNDGLLYIADQKNSRIVILNPDYSGKMILTSFVNMWGVPDSLSEPKGVYATEDEIFVADTEKNRIVVFSKGKTYKDNGELYEFGEHVRIVEQPSSDVFPEGAVYKPVALVVDSAGRIYVVSSTTNQGIISMSPDGEFLGFVGAQKAVANPFMIFWRNFQTRAQRQQSIRNVATEYNNIAIDDEGFVYVTTSSIDEASQLSAMFDKGSEYHPVKRLNPQGADVMRRSGFSSPDGEIYAMTNRAGRGGASRIIGIAIGPEATWSIIDEARQKVFTYDEDGRLLFIFGDEGQYFGNIQSIQAVAYQGTKMLLLDKTLSSFTVYKRTAYGDIIIAALENQRNRQYDNAVNSWKEILKRNNNSDLAYIGIGKSLYRDGEYQAAMRQFRFAMDTKSYSQSFKMYRKLWIENNVIVIPIFLIIFFTGFSLFMKHANKVNKRDQIRYGRKLKLGSHMLYGLYIIFHPFDGFWDMKHEKRGSPLAATIYLFLACAVYIYKAIGEAFIVNPEGIYNNFIGESISVILPVTLWVIANWCLTTLFDGEGSMKDIYMVTCYALIPIIPIVFFSTLATHIITLDELQILSMVGGVMFVWVGMLLFFGTMVIHDYSLGKNVVTAIGSIVGMAFIMFVTMLFSGLLMKMIQFINSIYVEVSYRL